MKSAKGKPMAPSGKKREDRTAISKTMFDPVALDCKTAQTVILALNSQEDLVVIQALASLDKFAMKLMDNVVSLLELGLLNTLMPLIFHTDLYIQRICSKLLGVMCSLNETKAIILGDQAYIEHIVDMLTKDSDVVIHEFTSLILSELASLHTGCAQVLETNILEILFTRITSPDPDVQKNCVQIMGHVLNDPTGSDLFVKCSEFALDPILKLLLSEYPVIQNLAIHILDMLTKRRKDEETHELIRRSTCIEKVFDILEIVSWKDLHPQLLAVLSNVADSPEMVVYMNTTGCINRLLLYMDNIQDTPLVEAALRVAVKIGSIEEGRKVLNDNHVVEELMPRLHNESTGVSGAACQLLALMTQDRHALEVMVAENSVRDVMGLARKESRDWELRQHAANATCHMLRADRRLCNSLLESNRQDQLLSLLRQPPGKTPVEMIITVVNCFTALGNYEDTRTKVLEMEIISALVGCFQDTNIILNVAICYCLVAYACEALVRDAFVQAGGVSLLMKLLMDNSTVLRQAVALLVTVLACDVPITTAIIQTGALQWMLSQKSTRRVCPSWETAIEALFKNCLPAKFALMGRLDLHDVTTEGFYASRCSQEYFLVLEELLASCASPYFPIYVVNFKLGQTEARQTSALKLSSANQKRRPRTGNSGIIAGINSNKKNLTHQGSSLTLHSDEEITGQAVNYEVCTPDPYLAEYVKHLNNALTAASHIRGSELSKVELSIHDQARITGQFVAEQMCGANRNADSSMKCDIHSLEMNLNELKFELGTYVIPLGFLRVGQYFERALLFKVLADRIGLPCSLVRGQYGRSWVEVATPEPDAAGETYAIPLSAIPSRLLRPNNVVDLVEKPGTLMPLGSYRADKYCGKPL